MLAQLLVNVLVSGIKILTMGRGLTRRTRFIAAMSLAVGLGVTIVPQFVNVGNDELHYPRQGPLWPTRDSWSPGFRGARTHARAGHVRNAIRTCFLSLESICLVNDRMWGLLG